MVPAFQRRSSHGCSNRFFVARSRLRIRCTAAAWDSVLRNASSKPMEGHWFCAANSEEARSLSPRFRRHAKMILPNETAEFKMNAQILLVEDEPGLGLTVADLLRREGYAVEPASDGESGSSRAPTRSH